MTSWLLLFRINFIRVGIKLHLAPVHQSSAHLSPGFRKSPKPTRVDRRKVQGFLSVTMIKVNNPRNSEVFPNGSKAGIIMPGKPRESWKA